jgi:formylglycine-generating enzyme required for sulfatase activity
MTFCNRLSIREGLFPCYFFDEGYTIPLDTLINNYPTELPNIRVYFDPSASGYRLPIESEWEFAGRGGIYTKNYKYAGSNDPSLVNPFQSGGGQILPYPIGTKMPNELGLYDMCGNVPEWCSDLFEDYVTYPSCIYFLNSIRGGLIHNPIYSDLSVRRTYSFPQPIIFYLFGFRLARNAD